MARYQVTDAGTTTAAATQAAGTGNLAYLGFAATAYRSRVTRFQVLPEGSAADNQYVIAIERNAGTSGAGNCLSAATWGAGTTPQPNNTLQGAAHTSSGVKGTASVPTGNMTPIFTLGYNYRAGCVWVASDEDGYIIIGATAYYGLLWYWAYAQGTDAHGVTIEFDE